MPAGALTGTVVEAFIKIFVYEYYHSIQINVGGYKSWLWHWITRRCTWRAPETMFCIHYHIFINCHDNVPGLASGQFPAVPETCSRIAMPIDLSPICHRGNWKAETWCRPIHLLPMDLSKTQMRLSTRSYTNQKNHVACFLAWFQYMKCWQEWMTTREIQQVPLSTIFLPNKSLCWNYIVGSLP